MDKVTRFVCLLLLWGMVITACQSPPTPTIDQTATAETAILETINAAMILAESATPDQDLAVRETATVASLVTATAAAAATATASLESDLPIQTFSGRLDRDHNFIPCGQEQTASEQTYQLLVDQPFLEMVEETRSEMQFAMVGSYGPQDELAIFVRFQGKQYEDHALIRVTDLLEMRYYLVPRIPCD